MTNKGFTLVEVLAVLIIISIVATASITSWEKFYRNFKTKHKLELIINIIHNYRSRAILENSEFKILSKNNNIKVYRLIDFNWKLVRKFKMPLRLNKIIKISPLGIINCFKAYTSTWQLSFNGFDKYEISKNT